MTNPFAPTPYLTGSSALVSGGGADGYIDHVVTLCLQRSNPRTEWSVSAQIDQPDARQFDLAELISQSAAAAGITAPLPTTADALLRYCRRHRTVIPLATGLALKGALLFGQNSCALSLGSRGRAIVFSQLTGVVVDGSTRTWDSAARIPGARGYR